MMNSKVSFELKKVKSDSTMPGEKYDGMNGHSCHLVKNKMYVIGGDKERSVYYIIDLDTYSVIEKHAPISVQHHSASLFTTPNETFVIVFGGEDSDSSFSSDIHKLSITEHDEKWEKLLLAGSKSRRPNTRVGHKSVPVYRDEDPYMLVFGGYSSSTSHVVDRSGYHNDLWKFRLLERCWEEVETDSSSPHPVSRVCHSFEIHHSSNTIYLFGGFDGKDRTNDLWQFDIEKLEWKQLILKNHDVVGCRSAHRMKFLENPHSGLQTPIMILTPGSIPFGMPIPDEKVRKSLISFWEVDVSKLHMGWKYIPSENNRLIWDHCVCQYGMRLYFYGGKFKVISGITECEYRSADPLGFGKEDWKTLEYVSLTGLDLFSFDGLKDERERIEYLEQFYLGEYDGEGEDVSVMKIIINDVNTFKFFKIFLV